MTREQEKQEKREKLRFNENLEAFAKNQLTEDEDIKFLQSVILKKLNFSLGDRVTRLCRAYVLKGCCEYPRSGK